MLDKEEIATMIRELLCGRTDDYALQQNDGKYVRTHEPLTEEIMLGHLNGELTIAAYVLDEECHVKSFCIDVDAKLEKGDKDINLRQAKEAAFHIARTLDSLEIEYIPEFSGRKGYHLWVPLDVSIHASDAITFMRCLLLSVGWEERGGRYSSDDYRGIHCEVFPKQPKPGGKGLGCDVKLPLGMHRKSGKYSYLCNKAFRKVNEPGKLLTKFPISGTTDRVRQFIASGSSKFIIENLKSPQRINDITRIKKAFSIEDMFEYLSGEKPPKDNGEPYTINCLFPDHDDNDPSMSIYPDSNYFICGGCGFQGDIFDAYAIWHGIQDDFPRVLAEVADIAGVELYHDEDAIEAKMPYRLITIDEVMSNEFPQMEFKVKGILPESGIAVIYGKEKVGKTLLATQLAIDLARGTPFLGELDTKGSRVAYVSTDMILEAFKDRLEKNALLGKPIRGLGDRFVFIRDSFKLDDKRDVEGLLASVMENNSDVLIIDTLSSSMTGDENSSRDMQQVIEGMRMFTNEGIAVVLVHHEGKDNNRKERGSSRLPGAVDSMVKLEFKQGRYVLSFDRLRHGKLDRITLKLDPDRLIFRRADDNKTKNIKCSIEDVVNAVGSEEKTRKKLIKELMGNCDCKEGTASNAIKTAVEQGRLNKRKGGHNGIECFYTVAPLLIQCNNLSI